MIIVSVTVQAVFCPHLRFKQFFPRRSVPPVVTEMKRIIGPYISKRRSYSDVGPRRDDSAVAERNARLLPRRRNTPVVTERSYSERHGQIRSRFSDVAEGSCSSSVGPLKRSSPYVSQRSGRSTD